MKESDSEIDLFESITDEKEEKSIAVPKKVQSFEQFKECNDKASIPETFLLTGYELIQTEEEVRTNIMQEYIRGGSKNNSTGKKGKCVLELYDSILRYQLNRKDWQKFKYHVNKASRIQELLRRVLKEVFDASVVLETIQQDFEVHVNYIFKCEAEDIGQVVAKAIGEEAEQLIEFATLAMCRHISKEMFEAFIQDQQDSKKREIESFISQLTIDEKYQHFKGTNNPNPEKAFSSSLGIHHKEKSSTCSNKARKKSKKQRNKSLFESLKDNTNQLENGKSLPQFIENRSQNHRFIHKEPEKNKIDISDPLEIEDLSVSDKYMDFPKVKKRKNLQNEHDPKMIPSQNLDDHTEVGDSEDSQLGKRLNPSIIPQKSQKHTSKEEINLEEEMNRGSKYFSSSDQNNSKVISQHHDSSKNRSKESISIQVVNSNNEKKRGVISDLHENVEESGLKPSTKYERFPNRKIHAIAKPAAVASPANWRKVVKI